MARGLLLRECISMIASSMSMEAAASKRASCHDLLGTKVCIFEVRLRCSETVCSL